MGFVQVENKKIGVQIRDLWARVICFETSQN